jgi:hypothetical protein
LAAFWNGVRRAMRYFVDVDINNVNYFIPFLIKQKREGPAAIERKKNLNDKLKIKKLLELLQITGRRPALLKMVCR